MSAMNPINEIFLKTIQMHDTKWYQVIKRLKLAKEIDFIISHLLHTQDIFTFSDEFFCVFSAPTKSIDTIKEKYKSSMNIYRSIMNIDISEKCSVKYSPNYKEFTVIDLDYGTFTISKGTTINGNIRKSKWVDAQNSLRQFYIKVITDAAWKLAENTQKE